ncbi:MAG: oligosaccharide flippase family protein [Gammaproteobacteria bacterium]|nr:oligosaccharide flippase family protein [Gammaproteobacteria bacterium]
MRFADFLTRHKAFLGNVATMMSGKSIAAGIALVTMPIIARLFSPSDFGIAALFLSLGVVVSNVGALRYENALVLPDQEAEALLLMAFAYRLLIFVCAVLLLIIGGYELSDLTVPVLESLGMWLWLLPLSVLLLTMVTIQENWLARRKMFKVVATSMVVGTAVTGGARIGFGALAGSSVFGLVVGHMFGQVFRLAVQKSASSEGFRATFRPVGWTAIRRIATKYSDFPRLNAPAALLTAATQQLPVILFGVLFSPAVVGFYAMATRVSHVPIVVVANSVRRVFLQKAAEIGHRGRSLRSAFLLSTGGLVLLGAGPLAVLWFSGQPLATWLLGERWSEAGRYLEIISPWLFMIWVTAPSNPVFIVLRKQRVWLHLQLATTVFRMSTFGIAFGLEASPEWTLGAFVIATVIGNVVIIGVSLLLITRHHGPHPENEA